MGSNHFDPVHTETLKPDGLMLFGRTSRWRPIFQDALAILVQQQAKVAWFCGKTMSLEDAAQAYQDFEQRKLHNIVFKMSREATGRLIEEKAK
jgi:threonine dehydrogenase-like Zn-dependent dehydrogenase